MQGKGESRYKEYVKERERERDREREGDREIKIESILLIP